MGMMKQITLTQHNLGQTIFCAIGDQIIIRLKEIPTAGYIWQPEFVDPGILRLEKSQFSPVKGPRVGGRGERTFIFTVINFGETLLRLVLRRKWEAPSEKADRFYVMINSTPYLRLIRSIQ
jgi:predicted secreted protein